MNRTTPVRRGAAGLTGALVVAALALSACGGGSSGAPSSSASSTGGPSSPANARGGFAGGAAATGTIAQIDGDAVQVQNTSEQTTVDVTSATGYTMREKASLAAVRVGSCVVAAAPASSSGTGSATNSATSRPTAITASTVAIAPAVNGTCTGGFGGGAARPSGAPTAFPSGEHTGARPSGVRRAGFGDIVTGKVTELAGSTIIVDAVRRGTAGTTATVTVTSATTYTATVRVTRTALKVGLCAAAFGSSDSTGAVHATRVELSVPVSGSCTSGFTRRGATSGGPNG